VSANLRPGMMALIAYRAGYLANQRHLMRELERKAPWLPKLSEPKKEPKRKAHGGGSQARPNA
jgi:hypothetical protein